MQRLAILLVVSWAIGCGGDEPGPTGPIAATITHYDYRFDVDTRAAHTTVLATVDTAGDCLTLPYRAEGLVNESVRIDGAAPVSVAQGNAEITFCGAGHRAGETLTIDADLTIPMQTLSTSQVGYSIARDSDTNPFYYLVSWVGGCDRFGPCDNRPDQFATYTFTVTHPATLKARCSGAITEVSPTETRCEFTHAGGPTYSTFGVAAYPKWTERDKGTWGSARVTLYDRDVTTIDAAIDATYHAGFVAFMESTFGPYPYGDELRILTAPTYWSGFEHPGNIVLDDQLAKTRSSYADPVAHVLDHEIAHQWAGDQTTLADTYDFVWKEAMAEYLAYVYEDSVDPTTALTTASAWKAFSGGARYFPVPGEKPELFEYYGDVYGPGPMIFFRQLEVLSSREQVIAGLQSVLGAPRALSVDELVAALEASTGLSLADYAAAWIRGTGAPDWPRIAVTFTPGAPGSTTSTVRVQLVNPGTGAPRTCKFHVSLVSEITTEVQLVEVDMFRSGIDQTLTVPTPAFTVASTAVDPLRECLVFPAAAKRGARVHPWRTARSLAQ